MSRADTRILDATTKWRVQRAGKGWDAVIVRDGRPWVVSAQPFATKAAAKEFARARAAGYRNNAAK